MIHNPHAPGRDNDACESRLARLARRRHATAAPPADQRSDDVVAFGESASLGGPGEDLEQCELCAMEIPGAHQHLLDIKSQRLLCACRACVILFDNNTSGGHRYRRLPQVVRQVADFDLDDALWERLGIPVDITFCFHSTPADRVVAFYPGPAGATESMLQLSAWQEIEALNPVVPSMEPDVEALLINRAHASRNYWIVPVDECYKLVGIMRTRWRGLSGGDEVWAAIERYFVGLRREAITVDHRGARVDGRPSASFVSQTQLSMEEHNVQ